MKRAITYVLLGLSFTPVIVDPKVFFPFVEGKAMFIRTLVFLAWALVAGYAATNIEFRRGLVIRARRLIHNPVFLAVSLFFFIFLISALTSFFGFRAYFGDVERGEGVIGMIPFFAFFSLLLLVFEKKDWVMFFKLSLLVGAAMFIDALASFLKGDPRPSSWLGNPSYLAEFYLFSLMGSVVVARSTRKWNFWNIIAWVIIPLAVIGILLTQTRGVMIGFIVGLVAVIILMVFGKKEAKFLGLKARSVALGALAVVILFSAFFFVTKQASFWRHIPGFNRLADVSAQDPTLRTRLISLGVSWNAIIPAHEGMVRFLLGWGPENFYIAYNKYYNPTYYQYEQAWFDRAHDKLMDVLVMHGILGLGAYLAIWGALLWVIFKKRRDDLVFSAAALFFGVSYFVQNLVLFDSLPAYVAFFFFAAFVAWFYLRDEDDTAAAPRIWIKTFPWVSGVFAFLLGVFLWQTLLPYIQMKSYIYLKGSSIGITEFNNRLDEVLGPYTYAQENIRPDLLSSMYSFAAQNNGKNVDAVLEKAITAYQDLIDREPYNPRNPLRLGELYLDIGKKTGERAMFEEAERYFRQALDLVPNRQDLLYLLGSTVAFEGRIDESLEIYKHAVELDPNVPSSHYYLGLGYMFAGKAYYDKALLQTEEAVQNGWVPQDGKKFLISVYALLIDQFRLKHETQNFVVAAQRLQKLTGRNEFEQFISYAQKGTWNKIQLDTLFSYDAGTIQ